MHKQNDTFKRLRAVMKDVNGDHRQIIKTMQDQIDYLMEFIEIQGEILEEKGFLSYNIMLRKNDLSDGRNGKK